MRVPAPPVPADASVFKFPRRSGLMVMLYGILGLVLVVPPFYALATGPIHRPIVLFLPVILGVGLLIALSIIGFTRSRVSVAVTSDGLWYLPGKTQSAFIPWSDVSRVEAQDRAQRLVLVDARDNSKIRLQYQMENFSKLREFILSHTSQAATLPAAVTKVFHRTWTNKFGFPVIAALLFFMVYVDKGQSPILWLACVGFVVIGSIAIALDPVLVTITESGVEIKYPGWKRLVPFDAIKGIMEMDMPNRGTVWPVVMILRKAGKPIKLSSFREGSVALQEALHSAWVAAGGHDRFPAA